MKTSIALVPLLSCACLFVTNVAFAQAKPADPWSSLKEDQQVEYNKRRLGLGVSVGGFFVPGRWEISNGASFGLEAMYRVPFDRRFRFEVGADGRFVRTFDSTHAGAGAQGRIVFGLNRYVEMDVSATFSYSRVSFDLPFFASRNAFVAQARWGVGFLLSRYVSLGVTPLAATFMVGDHVDELFAFEPVMWARFAPL